MSHFPLGRSLPRSYIYGLGRALDEQLIAGYTIATPSFDLDYFDANYDKQAPPFAMPLQLPLLVFKCNLVRTASQQVRHDHEMRDCACMPQTDRKSSRAGRDGYFFNPEDDGATEFIFKIGRKCSPAE